MGNINYQSSSDHTKYYNSDGKEVPSVTTILKILNKPRLVNWANYLGMKHESVDKALEKSSYIGTMVHNVIECHLLGKKFELPTGEAKTWFIEVPDYFNQYMSWRENNKLEPIEVEKQMVCEYFGGTCDFYGIYEDKKTIIDFKTSKSVYSSMFLQLGAYTYMKELSGDIVEQVGILTVNKNKCYITLKTREEIQKYIDIFLDISKLYMDIYHLNVVDGWAQEI